MYEADSTVEPQIELTTAVKDSSEDPMLTPLSKVPLGFVKPPTYSFATGSTCPCETFVATTNHVGLQHMKNLLIIRKDTEPLIHGLCK